MVNMKPEPGFSNRIETISDQSLSLCYQCGTCTAICPMGVPVRKLIRSAQLGKKDQVLDDKQLWYCVTCKLCELGCPRGVKIVDFIHASRAVGFEERKAPQRLEGALWSVYENGNPFGGKRDTRAKWADGLNVKVGKPAKHLLYVGCDASFDPRLQKVARSLAAILSKMEVDYSILGEHEVCCGDVVYDIGEEGYFEELVRDSVTKFGKTGAESIITISPHSYNMFKTVYPRYGQMPQVLHYTEFLANLLDKGTLKVDGLGTEVTMTYHDPCYLGRYQGVYEEPRKLLESIRGVKLTEMEDNKENALCCGGGGGMTWTEYEGERPSLRRVADAANTGASTMVTSCPRCIQHFEDGVKTKDLNLDVMDVSEILAKAMKLGEE
jgi:Fe-S oxidoreductase